MTIVKGNLAKARAELATRDWSKIDAMTDEDIRRQIAGWNGDPPGFDWSWRGVGEYLDRPLDEILTMPEVQQVFDSIRLGAKVPTPPVLIVQAVHDYLIDVEDIDRLADAYSAGGADVTYHRDAFNEHLLLHPLSAPMALRWLQDRYARRPLSDHLIRTKWPTMFNPMTYLGMARLAAIAAKVVTGKAVQRRPL